MKGFDVDNFEIDPKNLDVVHKNELTVRKIREFMQREQRRVYECLIDKVEACIADPFFLWSSAQGTCSYLERRDIHVIRMFCREVKWAIKEGYTNPPSTLEALMSLKDEDVWEAFHFRCMYVGQENPFTLDLPPLHRKVLTETLNVLYARGQELGAVLAKSHS